MTSRRLADPAAVIARQPVALQLRYLPTLAEIATENNSTTIFPAPVDFFKAFLGFAPDSTVIYRVDPAANARTPLFDLPP